MKKFINKFKLNRIAIAMISTLLSGGVSYAGQSEIEGTFATYNHYTFLSTLSGMAKMASLPNLEDRNDVQRSARMTAKVIQIRFHLMRLLMKELQNPMIDSMPSNTQHAITEMRSTLIQHLSKEPLGKYSTKQNLLLQTSVDEITEKLQFMTIEAAALVTQTHYNLLQSVSKGKGPQQVNVRDQSLNWGASSSSK